MECKKKNTRFCLVGRVWGRGLEDLVVWRVVGGMGSDGNRMTVSTAIVREMPLYGLELAEGLNGSEE